MVQLQNQVGNPERAQRIHHFRQQFDAVVANIEQVIKGKGDVVRKVLLSMTAGGHVMLKDLPGIGKTMLARAIAATIHADFKRIQFTPDLLPMDITGNNIFNLRSKSFEFKQGPIFTNLLLADELNRATPKTQSALLEVMAEAQVTVEGTTYPIEPPFLVIATMNPLDHDGTYALPAAQLDRFTMELSMGFPSPEAEMEILDVHLGRDAIVKHLAPVIQREDFLNWQHTVPEIFVSETVKNYLIQIMNTIRGDGRVLAPPSPRASIMLARVAQAHALMNGREYVTPQDIQVLAGEVLTHRLLLSGDLGGHAYVRDVLAYVPVPA